MGAEPISDEREAGARARFQVGCELFQQRLFAPAARAFREALELKPGHARSLFNLAMCEVEQGNREIALPLLRQAVTADPQYREAYCNLSLLLWTLGDQAEARSCLNQALERWPDDANLIRIRDGYCRDALSREVEARRKQLTEELIRKVGAQVLDGPFKGMRLNETTWWGDGDLGPRVLGTYEEELNEAVEQAIARQPEVVINIGCAEGHYAIGLARRLPAARVIAHDISAEARRLCGETAALNGVEGRLTIHGACSHALLGAHLSGVSRGLAVLDCEGAEMILLDPAAVPELRRCDLIIECHDFIEQGITATLAERFAATHQVVTVFEAGRNPNVHPALHHLHSTDRWIMVSEGRPEFMHWLVCWAKD